VKSDRADLRSTLLIVASVFVIAVALVPPVESAVPASRKCAAAKAKVTAAKASAKLACQRTAITKGIDVDPNCVAKVEANFAKAFAAIEAKGGCVTMGDAGDLEATVDGFVDDVIAALVPEGGFPTPTPTVAGTPGPTATPQPTPTCAGPLTHSNGLGQDYLDCAPLGTPGDPSTYDVFMAREAAGVSTIAAKGSGAVTCSSGDGAASCIAKRSKTECAIWCYTESIAGFVHDNPTTACQCPTTSDPTWN
jgi:hypothetical protein